MGRGIAARVKRAYLPTIFLIVLALLYVLLSDFSFTPVVFLSILLLIILASKKRIISGTIDLFMGVAYDRWNHYWCAVLALHRYWGIQSAGFPSSASPFYFLFLISF